MNWRFWVSLLGLPLLIIAIGGVIALLYRARKPMKLYLVGQAQKLSFPSNSRFQFVEAPPLPLDSLKANLSNSDGLLVYNQEANSAVIEVYVRKALPSPDLEALEQLLQISVLERKLDEIGVPPEKRDLILMPPVVRTFILSEKSKSPQSAQALGFLSMMLSFILFMLIMNAGWQTLLSVLEEKTNRLAEYLLIYISPEQLLTGKLLAGIFLTVLQAAVWVGFAAVTFQAIPSSAAAFLSVLSGLPWGWIGAYVVGGVLLYTFLYAIGGAASDSVTELSSFAQLLQWPLIISFILISSASLEPNSPFSVFLSYFPLTSPLAMPMRLAGGGVESIELVLSVGLLWGSVLWARSGAARIYRRALLLYGQKLSWKGIWSLLRRGDPKKGNL
ncbi:MAG: ABC transporter permease [Bacteroidia bacterium]|nr:ABC transporter permease [Bacteroidia bacterium]MCX7764085.1 ABC transporter permease [Bacteroidia bacterium]MDW8057865.1 ABC transporter permease [Bacteroidia bacterium]